MNSTPTFDHRVFGLESRDLRVYRAMLEFRDPVSIRQIAEHSRLNRGTTFEIIKKLVLAGMVISQYKNKRKYYAASPPSALTRYAQEKQQKMTDQLDRVDLYVQQLEKTKQLELSGQFTQFYEGEEEIAALLRDVLDTVSGLELKEYRVISSAEIRSLLYSKFRNFTRQRIAKGLFAKVISIGEGGDLAELSERRSLGSNTIPACYLIIYADKVAQISLTELGIVEGAVVQNQGVAQMQQLMFDHLWAIL